MSRLARNQVIVGDARTALADLPAASVDCAVTSPPYFKLRNYGTAEQIGLESHVGGWVDELAVVMSGVARVLKPTGSLWLNLGDTYARRQQDGAGPKSLLLAPERLALQMLADGWTLRNKIIWAKPNGMPSSVRDRLACKHEVLYHFVRSRSYYFDLDVIRVPHTSARRTTVRRRSAKPVWSVPIAWRGPNLGSNNGLDALKASGQPGHLLGKNPGDVWIIPTANYRGAHHAVYPEKLIERPITATCPERVCTACGAPWRREPYQRAERGAVALGALRADCRCDANWQPGVVFDPFMGAGTTAVVAERLGRDWLGIEVNPAFAEQANHRIASRRTGSAATREGRAPAA